MSLNYSNLEQPSLGAFPTFEYRKRVPCSHVLPCLNGTGLGHYNYSFLAMNVLEFPKEMQVMPQDVQVLIPDLD
jgi:hypothetical protein